MFLAVVGSLIFAGCAWLFSFGNSVDMFDEIRRMDKRQVSKLWGVGFGNYRREPDIYYRKLCELDSNVTVKIMNWEV